MTCLWFCSISEGINCVFDFVINWMYLTLLGMILKFQIDTTNISLSNEQFMMRISHKFVTVYTFKNNTLRCYYQWFIMLLSTVYVFILSIILQLYQVKNQSTPSELPWDDRFKKKKTKPKKKTGTYYFECVIVNLHQTWKMSYDVISGERKASY